MSPHNRIKKEVPKFGPLKVSQTRSKARFPWASLLNNRLGNPRIDTPVLAAYPWLMAKFSISRSLDIPAAPEVVFALVNNFREWERWSPWDGPHMDHTKSFSGPETGVGAKYAWDGKKSGTGSMEITSVAPNREIDVDLRFTRPWKAINPTTFTFEPTAQGTRVTWTMRGENKGISALFAKFFDMDKMLGKDFELGLNQLSNAARNS